PIELLDVRTSRKEYNNCKAKDETGSIGFHLYYPFGKTLNASVQLPDTAPFIAGPALGGGPVSNPFSGRLYTMRHVTESVTTISSGIVQRNQFEFVQTRTKDALEHYQGIYTLRVTTTDEMSAHLSLTQCIGYVSVYTYCVHHAILLV